jgi:hypothetical protein
MDLKHCQLVTGATKFTLADMLSQLNHLDDITHDKLYGGALGFTWAEIEAAFGPHVESARTTRRLPSCALSSGCGTVDTAAMAARSCSMRGMCRKRFLSRM